MYQVCYSRYQILFYLCRIGPALNRCKVLKYDDQDCRPYIKCTLKFLIKSSRYNNHKIYTFYYWALLLVFFADTFLESIWTAPLPWNAIVWVKRAEAKPLFFEFLIIRLSIMLHLRIGKKYNKKIIITIIKDNYHESHATLYQRRRKDCTLL